jgi:transcriptional regulator with XRE-family HTH domain
MQYNEGMDGQELTRRREALGLSRAALAKHVGVSMPTVWRWETEGRKPVPAVAKVLEQTLTRLEKRATPARPKEPAPAPPPPPPPPPAERPAPTPIGPRDETVVSALDLALEHQHALDEAQWARREGDLAAAEHWERIAAAVAESSS